MLQGGVKKKLAADVRGSPFLAELFRPQAMEHLLHAPRSHANNFKRWNLWNLALWHRHWFE